MVDWYRILVDSFRTQVVWTLVLFGAKATLEALYPSWVYLIEVAFFINGIVASYLLFRAVKESRPKTKKLSALFSLVFSAIFLVYGF